MYFFNVLIVNEGIIEINSFGEILCFCMNIIVFVIIYF